MKAINSAQRDRRHAPRHDRHPGLTPSRGGGISGWKHMPSGNEAEARGAAFNPNRPRHISLCPVSSEKSRSRGAIFLKAAGNGNTATAWRNRLVGILPAGAAENNHLGWGFLKLLHSLTKYRRKSRRAWRRKADEAASSLIAHLALAADGN